MTHWTDSREEVTRVSGGGQPSAVAKIVGVSWPSSENVNQYKGFEILGEVENAPAILCFAQANKNGNPENMYIKIDNTIYKIPPGYQLVEYFNEPIPPGRRVGVGGYVAFDKPGSYDIIILAGVGKPE